MIRGAAILILGTYAYTLGGWVVHGDTLQFRRPPAVVVVDSRPYKCAERLGIEYSETAGATEQLVAFQWCLEGRL